MARKSKMRTVADKFREKHFNNADNITRHEGRVEITIAGNVDNLVRIVQIETEIKVVKNTITDLRTIKLMKQARARVSELYGQLRAYKNMLK